MNDNTESRNNEETEMNREENERMNSERVSKTNRDAYRENPAPAHSLSPNTVTLTLPKPLLHLIGSVFSIVKVNGINVQLADVIQLQSTIAKALAPILTSPQQQPNKNNKEQ